MERNLFEFWRIEFINVIGRNAYFDKFQAIILYWHCSSERSNGSLIITLNIPQVKIERNWNLNLVVMPKSQNTEIPFANVNVPIWDKHIYG